jgi:isochorismate synthase EntC
MNPQNSTLKMNTEALLMNWLKNGAVVQVSPSQIAVFSEESLNSIDAVESPIRLSVRPFFAEKSMNVGKFASGQVMEKADLIKLLENLGLENQDLGPFQQPDFGEFSSQFERIFAYFHEGIEKVVPVVAEASALKMTLATRAKALCHGLRGEQKVYGIWSEDEGIIGVTPEELFRVHGSTFTTMALAGTYREHQGSDAEFLTDEKELSEHQAVIQGIKDTLPESVHLSVGQTEVLNLGKIRHLLTSLKAEVSIERSTEEMIDWLHPTPALGMSPRQENWRQILREFSFPDRKYFGGVIGVTMGDVRLALVMIRSVEWNSGGVFIPSGCGIVQKSHLESEWQELKTKRDFSKNQLGLGAVK